LFHVGEGPSYGLGFGTDQNVGGLAVLRLIVWRGIAKGEFRASPAADFPHLLLAPCKLSVTWQLLFGEHHKLDVPRYAEAHVEFVLSALRV